MTELQLEPHEVRKRVAGTILAELYDDTLAEMKKTFTEPYWAHKHTADMVAECWNKFYQHGIKVPKSRRAKA